MIKWPSIEQFRNVVRSVKRKAQFVGLDDNGEAIYNNLVKLPTLSFIGTVKLHGTNAGITTHPDNTYTFQSRTRDITVDDDNAGFCKAMEPKIGEFVKTIERELTYFHPEKSFTMVNGGDLGLSRPSVTFFGEWCGGNIQAKVGINQLPKMFVIFSVSWEYEDGRRVFTMFPSSIGVEQIAGVYSIDQFKTFFIDIDFNSPELSQNRLNELTLEVEECCPVAKQLCADGVGEGIVWRCSTVGWESSDFWFKVKGEAHSKSKVRTLATVDVERLSDIKELAAKVTSGERLEQVHQRVFNTLNGGETDIKLMGDFIKAVMSDVYKEESDTIEASGFSNKEVSKEILTICKTFIYGKL